MFILIHKHNLFESISDKIVQLMEFDQEQAVNMLLDNINQIPVSLFTLNIILSDLLS